MAKHKMIYPTLAMALDAEYRTDDLKKLAGFICPKVPTRKADRIEAIVSTIFDDPKKVFDQLSPLGQNAVSETVHTWGGIFERRMFAAMYSASPWPRSENIYGVTWDLLHLFLINGHIPMDLLEKLKSIVPKPPDDEIDYIDDITEDDYFDEDCIVRETSRAALANLATLLNLVADKKIRVSAKTGRATAATVRKLDDLLYDGDWYDDDEIGPMQSFAWPLLLQGGGLAKVDGSFLKLTPAGRKALKNDIAGGIKTAWKKWEKTKIIDEFSRVTAIKGQKSNRGRTMTSLVKRRPMINMLLEDLQPGRWIDLDELARVMQTTSLYSFDMVNYGWKLYFLDQHYGHLDYHDTWPLLQFRYLLVYLFEYCATLGIVDVVYKDPQGARSSDYSSCWGTDELSFLSHCDGLQYVRVNDLGAFALGRTDEFEVKNDNIDLFAFEGSDLLFIGDGTIPPGQALYLEKIAERKEVDRWRLSASSLLAAIYGGESLAEIKMMLGDASADSFSKEVEQLFKDVEQRSTAFVDVGKTTLIECGSEFRKQALTHK
ncbi:MAG: hypothetical protein U9R66_15075, partial [Thermodesulfobacteriota bacterium]|nr:hypothetical protein [Thermodesulfobacteriota bacterium]